jgi:HYR domain
VLVIGRHGLLAVMAVLVGVALAAAPGVSGSTVQAVGMLQIDSRSVVLKYRFGDYCPPGEPAETECVRFVGESLIPGLGRATTTYTKMLRGKEGCPVTQHKAVELEIAGKGAIQLSNPADICGPYAPATVGPQNYTVTGGTGLYAGASGSLDHISSTNMIDHGCRCGTGSESWRGTLTVPGMKFDVTAPTLTGARSKTIRVRESVRRARVRYVVQGADAVDGVVVVTCAPRSGSYFRLGRTWVACRATDASGNTARVAFAVRIRRG